MERDKTVTVRVTVSWPFGNDGNSDVETIEIDPGWDGDLLDHPEISALRDQLIFDRVDSWAEVVE
jgi:hypothetical protein